MKLSLSIRLALLLLVVFSVRIWFLQKSIYPTTTNLDSRSDELGWDCGEYIRYAKNLAFHGVFSHSEHAPFHPSAFRTPIYPAFLAPFCRFTAGNEELILGITLAQIGLAGVNGLLTYWIALRLTRSPNLAFAAGVVASLDLHSILLNFQAMAETLFLTLLLSTTLLFFRYLESSRLIHLGGSMIVLVLAGLCRPLALYFLPVFLLFVVWKEATRRFAPDIVAAPFTGANSSGGHAGVKPAATKPWRRVAKPALLAIAVFALTLTPWVLRNWCTMNYFVVYTNGSYMNTFLANGLLTVRKMRDPIPFLKIGWTKLDQMIASSLEELNATVGTTVRCDANIKYLLGLDHPEFTKQFESILQSNADQVLRHSRKAHLKSSIVTFLSMPFWSPREPLCRLLGERNTAGFTEIVQSARKRDWSEVRSYISELKCCRIGGYIWTYGYLVCLNGFAVIGLWSLLVRSVPVGTPPSVAAGKETIATEGGVPGLMPWIFLAILPFVLMAAPSWGTAVGWEMSRFRSPAIPFLAIFAVVGFALLKEKIRLVTRVKG